jgi:hypothetical protein
VGFYRTRDECNGQMGPVCMGPKLWQIDAGDVGNTQQIRKFLTGCVDKGSQHRALWRARTAAFSPPRLPSVGRDRRGPARCLTWVA